MLHYWTIGFIQYFPIVCVYKTTLHIFTKPAFIMFLIISSEIYPEVELLIKELVL